VSRHPPPADILNMKHFMQGIAAQAIEYTFFLLIAAVFVSVPYLLISQWLWAEQDVPQPQLFLGYAAVFLVAFVIDMFALLIFMLGPGMFFATIGDTGATPRQVFFWCVISIVYWVAVVVLTAGVAWIITTLLWSGS
jgi:hypothetical protein